MSFGGSVSAMIASIKQNARPKRKTYFDRNITSKNLQVNRYPLLDKKASPAKLKLIRDEITSENKKRRKVQILYYCVAIALITLSLWYLNS